MNKKQFTREEAAKFVQWHSLLVLPGFELCKAVTWRFSLKNQDFSQGKFVLTSKFTGAHKKGDLHEG